MGKLKVLIQNDQKEVKIPSGIRMLIRRCCHAVLHETGYDHLTVEISISLVENSQIKQLNAEYRKIDKETDVLSFPQHSVEQLGQKQKDDLPVSLGDVVISVRKATDQAELYGHSFRREIAYLTVHGALHLLGYDHEKGGLEAVRMREKEDVVLDKLGLPRHA